MTNSEGAPASAGVAVSTKGLATGAVGTFAGAVLGISSVAPGYTLTASIGLIVAAVGLKMPAIFIAGFIPMFLTAYATVSSTPNHPTAVRRSRGRRRRSVRTSAGCAAGAW